MLLMCVCNFSDSSISYKLIFCSICFVFEGWLFFFKVLDDQNTSLIFTLLPKALVFLLDVLLIHCLISLV